MNDQDLKVIQLSHLLVERNFAQAADLIQTAFQSSQVTRILHNLTEQSTGLITYAFVNYMIRRENTAFWHKVAACIASESLDKVPQGHNTGLYHILEAIKLDPHDWMLKEYALGFYQEGLLQKEKARQFSLEILAHEPANKLALKILAE